jgi:peptidyl-prolyl cis-trans isomerase D
MLTFFRKHATNWLIKVALFLIVIVFIFWGGYSYQARKASRVARVGDHYISYADYNESYNQLLNLYRSRLGNAFTEETIRQFNLKQQALDTLIQRYILLNVAKELGFSATVEEVRQEILDNPAFQTDGTFDQERYLLLLRQNRLSPEIFESQLAHSLTLGNVENFIRRQAVVTEEEVLAEFRLNHTPIQVDYVLVEPKDLEDQVTTEEDMLQKYYQEHQDKYQSKEKREFDFVLFKPDPSEIQPTDDEIQIYYESYPERFNEEKQVKARHILFRVAEGAPEDEVAKVRNQAEKVLEKAKQGEDFAELAKKHSQEPGAAQGGGDLGFFTRDRMVPAFSEAAFSMEKGQISDLVRTPFGFHIIKVEDIREERTLSLEEAKPRIEFYLKRDKSKEIAREKAEGFSDPAYAEQDLRKSSKERGLEVITSHGWISQNDPVKELGPDPKSMRELFSLPDKAVSSVLEFPEGFVVAQVKGIKPPQTLPFEKVKKRVEKDFKRERAETLAKEKAVNLLTLAKEKKSLEEVCKEKQMEVKKSEWFSRKEPDKNLLLRGKDLDGLFHLNETHSFPESPLKYGRGYLVCQLLGKKAPGEEILEKERSTISNQIYFRKQNQLWQSWLDEQRSKVEVEQLQEL